MVCESKEMIKQRINMTIEEIQLTLQTVAESQGKKKGTPYDAKF